MGISSKSIIHYTKSLTNLKSILLEGFKVKYCSEDFFSERIIGSLAAHPMVCFSDIPLSISFNGNWTYGNYAIGLTKSWAIKNRINPVLYLENISTIAEALGSLLKDRRSSNSTLTKAQKIEVMKFKCFTKNYVGHNSNLDIDEYNFYDEREWRFVPDKEFIEENSISLNRSKYEIKKDFYNNKISKFRLMHTHNDISFLVVNSNKEVSVLINLIRNEYKNKYKLKDKDIDLLISKITSIMRIKNDYSFI